MNTLTYFYSMFALLILLGCTQDSLQPVDGFTEKSITTFKEKTSQTQKASDAVDYEALLVQAANTPISALFAGGRIYQKINRTKGEKDTQQKSPLEEIKTSGFTTLILFTIHIQDNGDLMLNNDFPLVSNGVYIGDQTHPNFRAHMLDLLTDENSTIKRLEISLSAAGSGTFNHIRDRLNAGEGTGETSLLYQNFKALREALPMVYAISFDDESTYDAATATDFAVMLGEIGFKITLCPYTKKAFWSALEHDTNARLPGTVEAVYLQCYDGGSSNSPCHVSFPQSIFMTGWEGNHTAPIYPGLWGGREKNADQIRDQFVNWRNECGIKGGFVWIYNDLPARTVGDFGTRVNEAFQIEPHSIKDSNSKD